MEKEVSTNLTDLLHIDTTSIYRLFFNFGKPRLLQIYGYAKLAAAIKKTCYFPVNPKIITRG
jgi:hypothetical protein